jgi:hypothetical protein
MAKVFDRVKEFTSSTGLGDITTTGSYSSFQRFSDVLNVGDTTFYAIVDGINGSWESGLGTYASANVIERTKVLESSNSGEKVSFSSGEKTIFMTYPASQSITSTQSIALSIALG